MGHKKLLRFEEIKTFPNVLQYPQGMRGEWNRFFQNSNPITLELACGKGEYVLGLGRLYPNRNFIGVDLKGNRIWVGARKSLDEGLQNVAFLRTQIDMLAGYFAPEEVNEIWITFPDPQLRKSRARKRLTHPRFLRLYQQVLKRGGLIHLKTDSPDLYRFTKLVADLYGITLLEDIEDLSLVPQPREELKITTHYEMLDIAQSNRVHYLQFRLPDDIPNEKDEILKQMIREEPII